MESPYALMQFIPKHDQFQVQVKFNWVSASTFEDHRPEWTDFAVIHNSPSMRAGPGIVLFRKLKGGESSDKVLSWTAAIKRVTWQPLSKYLCSLCNSTELKHYIWPWRHL